MKEIMETVTDIAKSSKEAAIVTVCALSIVCLGLGALKLMKS